MLLPTTTPLGHRLAVIVAGLYGVIAPRAAAEWAITALLVRLVTRLDHMVLRLDRLVARWQAGTLAPPRPSRASRPRTSRPRLAFPRAAAWLNRLIPATARWSPGIGLLLASPECQALIADAPQAGRILRPLCHMLGIPLPVALRLPKRPRRPAPNPPPAAAAPPTAPPPALPQPTPPRPVYPVGFRPLPFKFSAT